jgi:cell division protein FtsX
MTKMMEGLIIAVITIVVAVALLPVVLNSVQTAVNSTTNTTYQALINVIPIIFIAGILVGVIYLMLKH